MTQPAALRVAGLSKTYGDVVALDDVDLEIERGQILGLLGHNGAGKSTLVSIVAGLRKPDRGLVEIAGINVATDPGRCRRLVGLAPQELGIYPTITVHENLTFFGELWGMRGSELEHRIAEVAACLSLSELLARPARFLSGGEKRRLHTAVALLARPPLLLLDEPTSGVDITTRAAILDVVRGLASDGTAICYSTHYLPEVETLGASVAILDHGHLVTRGSIDALVSAHASCVVEFAFAGPPPDLRIEGSERHGNVMRLRTERPAVTTAAVMQALGGRDELLVGIEVIRPSLDGVFLNLTGRRYVDANTTNGAVHAS